MFHNFKPSEIKKIDPKICRGPSSDRPRPPKVPMVARADLVRVVQEVGCQSHYIAWHSNEQRSVDSIREDTKRVT